MKRQKKPVQYGYFNCVLLDTESLVCEISSKKLFHRSGWSLFSPPLRHRLQKGKKILSRSLRQLEIENMLPTEEASLFYKRGLCIHTTLSLFLFIVVFSTMSDQDRRLW